MITPNFLDRINQLIPNGMSLYTWLGKMGMSRGVVDGLRKGGILSGESLAILYRVERINPRWLLTGDGTPYVVDHFADADKMVEHVNDIIKDEPETQVYNLNNKALLLVIDASLTTTKNETLHYKSTQLLVCDIPKALQGIETVFVSDIELVISGQVSSGHSSRNK